MRIQTLVVVGTLTVVLGCSSGVPIDTDPFPDGDVRTRQSGVSTAATLGIPPGHLPAPGECRIWEPGQPPGQQRRLPNGPCDGIERSVRPGQWLVYRPGENKKIVEIRTYDAAGSVGWIRIFDVVTGALLEEVSP